MLAAVFWRRIKAAETMDRRRSVVVTMDWRRSPLCALMRSSDALRSDWRAANLRVASAIFSVRQMYN